MLFFPYLCGDIIFIVMEEEKPKKKRKQKTVDGSKERKANWKEYTATVEDIKAFLSDHVYLRHNVITRRVECRLPSNYEHDGTDWQPVTDRIVNWSTCRRGTARTISSPCRCRFRSGATWIPRCASPTT